MEYKTVSKINIDRSKCQRIGEFLYEPNTDAMFFELPYPFPVQLLVSEGLSKIEVTPGFLRLPTILRGNINIDILCREIDVLKLILMDKLLLHASCVSGCLIVGFPQAGKTYNTYKSISEGAELISEEYTIIEKDPAKLYTYKASAYRKKARSCLSLKTITDCKLSLTMREEIQLFLNTCRAKLMPFMFESVIWKDIPVSGKTAQITHIVYGSSTSEIKDYRQLILLTENEFPYMSEYILECYAFITGLDLVSIQNKQRQMMEDFVKTLYRKEKNV